MYKANASSRTSKSKPNEWNGYGTTLLRGNFPNHSPNPEDAEAMDSAVAATVAAGADLGIIFDTDVDRSAVIDAAGQGRSMVPLDSHSHHTCRHIIAPFLLY